MRGRSVGVGHLGYGCAVGFGVRGWREGVVFRRGGVEGERWGWNWEYVGEIGLELRLARQSFHRMQTQRWNIERYHLQTLANRIARRMATRIGLLPHLIIH